MLAETCWCDPAPEHNRPVTAPVSIVRVMGSFLRRLDHAFSTGKSVLEAATAPTGTDNDVVGLVAIPRVQVLTSAVVRLLLALVERVTSYVPRALPDILEHVLAPESRYGDGIPLSLMWLPLLPLPLRTGCCRCEATMVPLAAAILLVMLPLSKLPWFVVF